jgi:uncharacterized protein (DUF362 family)
MSKLVSLVKGENRELNVVNALNLIKRDLDTIEEKERILIKPNLTSTFNPYANTSVESVKAIIDFLSKNFQTKKEILIIEGSGGAYLKGLSTSKVFERFGYYRLEKMYKNVSVTCVEELSDFFKIPVKTVNGKASIRVAKVNADYVISVAIPKTHDFAIATLGIKNMMGLIKQEDKILIHGTCLTELIEMPMLRRFYRLERYIPKHIKRLIFSLSAKFSAYSKSVKLIHHNLLSLAKSTLPDLVVLDGHYCMEGDGPIDGKPVKLGICIASTDALKADGVGVRVMGLKPEEIGYLYYIKKADLGEYSLDNLVGEGVEKVKRRFKMHSTYEIQRRWS